MKILASVAWSVGAVALAACSLDTALPFLATGDAAAGDGAPGPDLAVRPDALANPPCRSVSVELTPGAPALQIAVWIETTGGAFVDTLYLTQATGKYGIANRPGNALLKTDFRWPLGRREMVLPVWAHRRDHHYPRLVMGGACGNAANTLCPNGNVCGIDCDDNSMVYHPRISSYEPYFCSWSGASRMDPTKCAERLTFPKGAFADAPAFSLYPPRADLNTFDANVDSPDIKALAALNDLVAVSQATPPPGKGISPAPRWAPAGEGDYVVWAEVSAESDFNASHNHPNVPDSVKEWEFLGHPFLGQPSIVYRLPFHVGAQPGSVATVDWAGYGSWDGSDGVLRSPDQTITRDKSGSGAQRLLESIDAGGNRYRLKVAIACP